MTTNNPITSFNQEAVLVQTLLKLAVPGLARYVGHACRPDTSYGVVVDTPDGFRTITVPSAALALVSEGVLVEQDRLMIRQQLAVK